MTRDSAVFGTVGARSRNTQPSTESTRAVGSVYPGNLKSIWAIIGQVLEATTWRAFLTDTHCMARACATRTCQGRTPWAEPDTEGGRGAGSRRPYSPSPRPPFAPSWHSLRRFAACGPASATLSARCCGENAVPQHALPARATGSGSPRNSRIHGIALSGGLLAIRAVRLGQGVRELGGAGATPENAPRVRNRALRRGRSRESSLQEDRAPFGAQSGLPRASRPSFVALG